MNAMIKPVLIRVDRHPDKLTDHPRHIHPPLELKYVQAGIEKRTGYNTPILDGWSNLWSPEKLTELVVDGGFRIAIIKGMSYCVEESIQLGKLLREQGIITVAVGQFVSHAANQRVTGWQAAFNITFLGEPEEEVPSIAQRLMSGEVLDNFSVYNQRFQRNECTYIQRPEELPMAKYATGELEKYPFPFPVRGRRIKKWGYIMTSWGCPHRCTLCSNVVRKSMGAVLRSRTPKTVVDEIEAMVRDGAQGIYFDDDTLLSNRKEFLEMCRLIVERKLKFSWVASCRIDELDDERIAMSAKAGAVLLKVGVESATPRIIKLLGKSKRPERWVGQVEGVFKKLNKHKIGTVALYMVGCPDETEEEVHKTIQQAIRLKPDYVQSQIFSAYPDSPFYQELPESEKEKYDFDGNVYHYTAFKHSPSQIDPDKLLELQNRFYRKFYLRPGYMARHGRLFWRYYLHYSTVRTILGKVSKKVTNLFSVA